MGSEAYLFQGGVNGGNAIASGAQQYMENRKQSQALDGSLDRMGSMLASFAEQHPGSITAADQRLIDQIAKAPGQGLAQKKAAYADGMTWLKMKSDEVNDASLARYHDAQAVNMERTYQAGLAKAAEEKDTREAQRFMLNPETKFRKNSLGWPEEVGPDARLAEALDKYPNANPPDVQKVVKDQDTGWQLKKGEIITFEDGSKGYPTSQNSMVIKNPETGTEIDTNLQPLNADGTTKAWVAVEKGTGKMVKIIADSSMDPTKIVEAKFLAKTLGIDFEELNTQPQSSTAKPDFRFDIKTGQWTPGK